MKMLAKLLCLIMALAMMVTMFAACGDDKEETKDKKEPTTSSTDKEDKEDKEEDEDEDKKSDKEDEEDEEDEDSADSAEITGSWSGKVDLAAVLGIDDAEIGVEFEFKKNGKYTVALDEDDYKDMLIVYVKAQMEEAEMTEEDFEDENGKTIEEYVDEEIKSVPLELDGTYEVDGDEILFDEDEETESKATFEFSGSNKLTIDWQGEIYSLKRD